VEPSLYYVPGAEQSTFLTLSLATPLEILEKSVTVSMVNWESWGFQELGNLSTLEEEEEMEMNLKLIWVSVLNLWAVLPGIPLFSLSFSPAPKTLKGWRVHQVQVSKLDSQASNQLILNCL
jgi:hypothetical protein